MDKVNKDYPILESGLVIATPSCICIGTLMEHDGTTSVVLTDNENFSDSDLHTAFQGTLETPSHNISICTVDETGILSLDVSGFISEVRVLVNDDTEPDRIAVVVY